MNNEDSGGDEVGRDTPEAVKAAGATAEGHILKTVGKSTKEGE